MSSWTIVDNSNICIGCQFLPNGTRDFSQRLSIQKFAQAVAGVRQVSRQVVVGSKPPRSHAIWQHWENAGYQAVAQVLVKHLFLSMAGNQSRYAASCQSVEFVMGGARGVA